MEFREYQTQDFAGVCELIRNELGYPVTSRDLEERIAQMHGDDRYRIFVASDGVSVTGFIGITIGLAFEIPGRIMTIIALAISQAHQGSGIGSSLVRKAEDFGMSCHVSAILVSSGILREAAHRFYEKQGFHKKGYSFMKQSTF